MKKWVMVLMILILTFFITGGCINSTAGIQRGSLQVCFRLDSMEAQQINNDFSQVNSGKVFLKQGGVIQYQSVLTIDTVNKTGQCVISDIQTGSYDVAVELYDSSNRILYVGQSTVTINNGNNGATTVTLTKNIARLTISGSWTGENSGLSSAIVQLKKSNTVIYAGNLILDTVNRTILGGIDNIIPDTYDVYVEVKNSSNMVLLTGLQSQTITAGDNSVIISLNFQTGSISINFIGDVTAPKILAGPNSAVNGDDVTITWTTDENATSNVCYSTVSGFNYQTQTTWAPLGRDLTADHTVHNVMINNLACQTYYYVIVSADASGNSVVSSESSFVMTLAPTATPTPTLAPTPTQTPTGTVTLTPTLTPSLTVTPTPTNSNSRRIVFYSTRDGNSEIYIMDADGGNQTRLTNCSSEDKAPDLSPDRSKIVFQSNRDGYWAIYRMNADGSNLQRITNDSSGVNSPVWSPDGSKILVCKTTGLYLINPDGSNPTLIPNSGDGVNQPGCPDWSPDGNKIVFMYTNAHLYVINTDGSGLTCLTNATDLNPSWSPYGNKIAFTSMRDGYRAIYIMNTDGSNQTCISGTSGISNAEPCWSPVGDNIAFSSNREGAFAIFTMKSDGTGASRLTSNKGDCAPSWR